MLHNSDVTAVKILSAIKIQNCFRHFIRGRSLRKSMKYKYKNIWEIKSFAVMSVLDSPNFTYSKSYKDFINYIYNSLETCLYQDSDDECEVALSKKQLLEIRDIQKKYNILFNDIKSFLKSLSIDQLKYIYC